MNIFKRIWAWLIGTKKQDKEACAGNFEKEYEKKYNTGGFAEYTPPKLICSNMLYIPKPPPQNSSRDFKRELEEHFRQQQARRDSDDNFLMGAMVGYVIADSLNDSPSARDIEVPKSSNYESSYTPSSSSSYDSGSYSSSSDSGSSSSSCDSGC